MRRQQTSQDAKGTSSDGEKIQSMETLLAQKRDYQKHLRSLQQTSIAKNVLQGKQHSALNFPSFNFIRWAKHKLKVTEMIEFWKLNFLTNRRVCDMRIGNIVVVHKSDIILAFVLLYDPIKLCTCFITSRTMLDSGKVQTHFNY